MVRCHASQQPSAQQVTATALALTTGGMLASPVAQAAEQLQQLAEADGGALTLAVGGSAAIAGLGALLVATDPQRRCVQQHMPNCAVVDIFSNIDRHEQLDGHTTSSCTSSNACWALAGAQPRWQRQVAMSWTR